MSNMHMITLVGKHTNFRENVGFEAYHGTLQWTHANSGTIWTTQDENGWMHFYI